MIAKKEITPQALPPYLSCWTDKALPLCIYTPAQINKWALPHLQNGLWYLECPPSFSSVEEEDEKAMLLCRAPTTVLEDDQIDILEAPKDVLQPMARPKGKTSSSSLKPVLSKATQIPNMAMTVHIAEGLSSSPNDNDIEVLSSFPSTLDLATSVSLLNASSLIQSSHTVLQSKVHAAALTRGSSALHSPISVFIENTSINNLMEAMGDDSIMAKMHAFVEKVLSFLHYFFRFYFT